MSERDEKARRFLAMFEERHGLKPNANNLAGFLDCSASTARRILKRLRDQGPQQM